MVWSLVNRRQATAHSGACVSDDRTFLEECVSKIPGWLHDFTALRTMELLRWQEEQEAPGFLFEIGVFAGRYFSILIRSALRTKAQIIGLDTFQYVPEPAVREHLRPVLTPELRLTFLQQPSTNFTASDILQIAGEKARFISVDGSHEAPDVFWDLRLAEELLGPKGIVAVDDFLNPMTLGVNDAVNRFFTTPRGLVPFGYVANKLFLCRPPLAADLRQVLEAAIVADADDPRSAQFINDSREDRNRVEARMWGHTFVNAH